MSRSRLCVCLLFLSLLSGREARAQIAIEGVYVDPDGVMRTVMTGDDNEQLAKLRRQAGAARASGSVAVKSPMRKVSLTRLAKEVQALTQAGQPITDEMRFLAGLQQIRYVFLYPDEKDVVIAGPAEGWDITPAGRVVGQSTKRPVVRLDDLVIALRVFRPGGDPAQTVWCTIHPTQDGQRRLTEYMTRLGRSIDARQVDASLVEGARQSLGLQTIEISGVPDNCRLALSIVEADYRMKLISLGLEDPRVKGIVSYVSLLGPGSGGMSVLQRFWFVADYEAIVEGAEGAAFELRGQRVRLLAANDVVKASGEIDRKETADSTAKRFIHGFTKHYEELARVNPIYAELQNAFDVLIVAALVQDREPTAKVASELGTFLQPGGYSIETVLTPKLVETAVNARWIGRKFAMPMGGVLVEPSKWIRGSENKLTTDAKLGSQRQSALSPAESAKRWWWD